MTQTMPIYLASASPRRREILAQLGVDFEVCVSDADESITENDPGRIVETLAERKAGAVFAEIADGDAVVLGSDTVVAKDGEVLGKPKDAADAASMLRKLSADTNTVYTGVCIMMRRCGKTVKSVFHCAADVAFAEMSDAEIDWYVGTGEPMDKAGAYAVQGLGGRFVRSIHGDYYTVMGLPMQKVYETLRKFGVLLDDSDS
ncbi:MAG: septum formation inhibitor Maf [Lachnospiraceae bacterium]|nr:septum formation inhibitor Maf [Lachnospiraceae bacterium]